MQIISSFDDQISKAILDGWFPDRSISVRQLIVEGTPLEKHDTELLNKIRAEIEFEVDHRTNMLCAEDVFRIIDKYKTESKVEELEQKPCAEIKESEEREV